MELSFFIAWLRIVAGSQLNLVHLFMSSLNLQILHFNLKLQNSSRNLIRILSTLLVEQVHFFDFSFFQVMSEFNLYLKEIVIFFEDLKLL